jgi:hypothetical protein
MSKTTSTKKAVSAATSSKKSTTAGSGAADSQSSKAKKEPPAKDGAKKELVSRDSGASSTAGKSAGAAKPCLTETPREKAVTRPTDKKPASSASCMETNASPQETDTYVEVCLCPEDVAVRAYYLWESEGYQHGRDPDHWFRAEEQLRNELSARLLKSRPRLQH